MFRKEEAEDYLLTDIEEKKRFLYFLYLYHENYENESRENKSLIREYYDTELRYKGAFYRDRKTFKEKGNPLYWIPQKVKRYKVKTQEMSYYRGIGGYASFEYPTQTLIQIELSKKIEMLLIDRAEGKIKLNWEYNKGVRDELENMKKIIEGLDNKKDTVIIRKGWERPKTYKLSYLQIVFKVNTGDYIRYLSTPFTTPFFVIEASMNMLENYLANVTKIGSLGEDFTSNYHEYDEDFQVEFCRLERIYIKKRTNIQDTRLERERIAGYDLDITNLSSINIKEVIAT